MAGSESVVRVKVRFISEMIKKLLNLKIKTVTALYIIIDVLCLGAGMGVPIFCILLGFPAGWYIAGRSMARYRDSDLILRKILSSSVMTSAFTFLMMIIIWGRMIPMLFDPLSDFNNFGHPYILYDPKISFIGWLVLMIFISPILQLLTTVFASHLTLIRKGK
jgi:hypothetical protein